MSINSSIDIHSNGFDWAVLDAKGRIVPNTVEPTGYSARSAMVREHQLIWSNREAQGYTLARLLPQTMSPLLTPRVMTGVTGAAVTFTRPGFAVSQTAVEKDDVVGRTLEAVELALAAAGFDISNPLLQDALNTALDGMYADTSTDTEED